MKGWEGNETDEKASYRFDSGCGSHSENAGLVKRGFSSDDK
jgi:hypothetical protein